MTKVAHKTVFILILLSAVTMAGQKSFRQEFIERHQAQQFDALEYLVKANKDIIPGEISRIITDAMAPDKRFKERIELLDIASKMAIMYDHAHGGFQETVKGINDLMLMEIERYEKEMAEVTEYLKMEERFPGNMVLLDRMKEMKAEGVAPVVYPHWKHRVWFKCKVCHESIFIPKRGSNDISMTQILAGKRCGACHNGKMAFAADKDCEKCHIADRAEVERMSDIKNVDHGRIKEIAKRLGAEWNIENLPEKSVPIDRFNLVDWVRLKEMKVIAPIPSLEKGFKEEIRDTRIYFKTRSQTISDVLFDHKIHSW